MKLAQKYLLLLFIIFIAPVAMSDSCGINKDISEIIVQSSCNCPCQKRIEASSTNSDENENNDQTDTEDDLTKSCLVGKKDCMECIPVFTGEAQLRTLMSLAIKAQNEECLQALIDRNVPAGFKPNHYLAPIEEAIKLNSTQLVFRLLETGTVNVSETNQFGRTIFHETCNHGRCEILEQLLQYADEKLLYIRDDRHYTPMHLAALRGHFSCAVALAESGHPVNPKGKNDQTPLQLALVNKQLKFAEEYFREMLPDTSIIDANGDSALMIAVRHRQPSFVKLLLSQENPFEGQLADGYKAHQLASEKSYTEIADLLAANMPPGVFQSLANSIYNAYDWIQTALGGSENSEGIVPHVLVTMVGTVMVVTLFYGCSRCCVR